MILSKTCLGVGARNFQLKMSRNAIASACKVNQNPKHGFFDFQFGKLKMMKLFPSSFSTDTGARTATPTKDANASTNTTSPLSKLKNLAFQKNLCDPDGFCFPNTHWTFVLSGNNDDTELPPSTRTVNFLRVSEEGIYFCSKNKATSAACVSSDDKPVSFLYTEGKYRPGENIVQYRANGTCQRVPLDEKLLSIIPEYTITEIVASKKARLEAATSSEIRLSIEGKQSRFTEIVQETRSALAKGEIPVSELQNCIACWRFEPEIIETMDGGPDTVMWNRIQYIKKSKADAEGGDYWESRQIMPF